MEGEEEEEEYERGGGAGGVWKGRRSRRSMKGEEENMLMLANSVHLCSLNCFSSWSFNCLQEEGNGWRAEAT